jgi:hypothetical protein
MKEYTFQPIEGRARTVALWLVISMITDALTIGTSVIDLQMLSWLDTLSFAALEQWRMMGAIGFVVIAVYLVTIVIFCFWIYRAAANAHALRPGLSTSPPWAIGWYFVPFACLFKPFTSMKEIWRASFRREAWRPTPPDAVVSIWWTFWILTCVTGNIAFRLAASGADASTLVNSAWFSIFSAITGICAAWNLRTIVLTISSAQTANHAHGPETSDDLPVAEPSALAPR